MNQIVHILKDYFTLQRQIRKIKTFDELWHIICNDSSKIVPSSKVFVLQKKQKYRYCLKRVSGVIEHDPQGELAQQIQQAIADLAKKFDQDKGRQQAQAQDHSIDHKSAVQTQQVTKITLLDHDYTVIICGLDGSKDLYASDHLYIMALLDPSTLTQVESIAGEVQLTMQYAYTYLQYKNMFKSQIIGRAFYQLRHGKNSLKLGFLAVVIIAIMMIPVRLSITAPSVIIPKDKMLVTAPVNGLIKKILVDNNQPIDAGQLLVQFDEADLEHRRNIAFRDQELSKDQYRKASQYALGDQAAHIKLTSLKADIETKKNELDYLNDLLDRSKITAPVKGYAIVDFKNKMIGKSVKIGEKLLEIAPVKDIEVQVFVPADDLIPLDQSQKIDLYLLPNPGQRHQATIVDISSHIINDPDYGMGYHIYAKMPNNAHETVQFGWKGSAKLYGEYVTFGYYLLRKPLFWFRSSFGF